MATTVVAPVTWVETISQLRLPSSTDERLQKLMDRNNEGLLSESEREELAALVDVGEQLSLVRAEALHILGRKP